tara:strand:+ start:178 stop:357 length:180 start_codon:yes stop_codon:yes gene_type:complete
MRLLIDTFGDTRLFKDRNIIGLPRWVIETVDPDFGFRYTKILSGIWYNKEKAIEIAKKQ